jgi:hypothetical protein
MTSGEKGDCTSIVLQRISTRRSGGVPKNVAPRADMGT